MIEKGSLEDVDLKKTLLDLRKYRQVKSSMKDYKAFCLDNNKHIS